MYHKIPNYTYFYKSQYNSFNYHISSTDIWALLIKFKHYEASQSLIENSVMMQEEWLRILRKLFDKYNEICGRVGIEFSEENQIILCYFRYIWVCMSHESSIEDIGVALKIKKECRTCRYRYEMSNGGFVETFNHEDRDFFNYIVHYNNLKIADMNELLFVQEEWCDQCKTKRVAERFASNWSFHHDITSIRIRNQFMIVCTDCMSQINIPLFGFCEA